MTKRELLSNEFTENTSALTACQAPAVRNKKRCRMHGCTKSSGAPVGSQNALKYGLTTKNAKDLKKAVRECIKKLI